MITNKQNNKLMPAILLTIIIVSISVILDIYINFNQYDKIYLLNKIDQLYPYIIGICFGGLLVFLIKKIIYYFDSELLIKKSNNYSFTVYIFFIGLPLIAVNNIAIILKQ